MGRAYLLSAPLSFIALYDFHEITLAVAPLGFAMYFLATRRTVPMILCLVGALLAKEEVALIGVGFGVALAFQRRWRPSAVVIVGSIVAFVVTLKMIIPAFAAGAPYQYLGRYASLGRDELEIARTLLLDPLRVLAVLVKGEIGSKIVFVLSLFGPGLGLALRAKWALIPSLPPLGYLMLSDYGGEHTLHNQYGAPLIPLALGASILGVAALGDRWRRRVTTGVVVSSVFLAFSFGGLPFSLDFASAFLRGRTVRPPASPSSRASRVTSRSSPRCGRSLRTRPYRPAISSPRSSRSGASITTSSAWTSATRSTSSLTTRRRA